MAQSRHPADPAPRGWRCGEDEPTRILAVPDTPRATERTAPLPQHYPDLATGEWITCFIDWTPAGR